AGGGQEGKQAGQHQREAVEPGVILLRQRLAERLAQQQRKRQSYRAAERQPQQRQDQPPPVRAQRSQQPPPRRLGPRQPVRIGSIVGQCLNRLCHRCSSTTLSR